MVVFVDGAIERQPLAYSVAGVVEATGIGETTIRQAIRDGLLKSRRIGAKIIVLREDAETYLKSLPAGVEKAA